METNKTASALVLQPGEGARRWFFGGGIHTWKATEDETGGASPMFEDEMALDKVTPMHTHPDSDETMYILAGEILMNIDGEEHRVTTGGVTIAAPRGVPHAFKVLQDGTLFCASTPPAARRRSTTAPANPSARAISRALSTLSAFANQGG